MIASSAPSGRSSQVSHQDNTTFGANISPFDQSTRTGTLKPVLCVTGTGIDEEDVVSKEQKTIDGKTVWFGSHTCTTMTLAH